MRHQHIHQSQSRNRGWFKSDPLLIFLLLTEIVGFITLGFTFMSSNDLVKEQEESLSSNLVGSKYGQKPRTAIIVTIDGNTAMDMYFYGSGKNGLSWASAYQIYNVYLNGESATIDPYNVGIQIMNTDRFLIIHDVTFTLYDEYEDRALELRNCGNILIENCEFTNNYYGLYLDSVYNCSIQLSQFSHNSYGNYVLNSMNNTFSNLTYSENYRYGQYIECSRLNTIYNNTFFDSYNGLFCSGGSYGANQSGNNSIQGNFFLNNDYTGLSLWNSHNNSIFQNLFQSNNIGCTISDSHSNQIFQNLVLNNAYGIKLDNYAEKNEIWNNALNLNEIGIYFFHSSDTEVIANNISNNSFGITILFSQNIYILNNSFLNNIYAIDYTYYYNQPIPCILDGNIFINNENDILSAVYTEYQGNDYIPPEVLIFLGILIIIVGFLIGYRKRIRRLHRKNTAKRLVKRSLRSAKVAQTHEGLQNFHRARKKWQIAKKTLVKAAIKFSDFLTREYITQNLDVIQKKIGISYISQAILAHQNGWKHFEKGSFKKGKKYYRKAITAIEDAIRNVHNIEIQDNSFTFPVSVDLLNDILRFYRHDYSYFQKDKKRIKSSKYAENIVDLSDLHQKVYDAIQEFNQVLWIYDQVLRSMQSPPVLEEISTLLEHKIGKVLNLLSNVQERTQILYNYARSLGKSGPVTSIASESFTLPSISPTSPNDQVTVESHQLKLIREYEFIGGRIRFKVGIQNQTGKVMTNLALRFDLPDSLIWVLHEPNYTRKGDTIHIPKLGGHEKIAISLYLEPINCLDSVINATLTYFDADDHPNALVMPSKPVSISCPIFFTREDANLARVKNLSLELKIKDRKIFPLSNTVHAEIIYNKLLETVGKHDVKLVTSEFNPTTQNGEAWFYGITKIKQQKMVIWISLDPSRYVLELTVWGDDQEQITGLLAELGSQLRQNLLFNHIIDDSKKFNEISTSILLGNCPYCAAPITPELLQGYRQGETIQCKYCDKSLSPY